MFKATFLTGLLLFVSLHIFAQKNTATTEKREMFFRIEAVKKITNDSILALIKGGTKLGITKSIAGPVKAGYISGSNRTGIELGFARVSTVTDSNALVIIRPIAFTDKSEIHEIRKGDYVRLNIQIPKLAFRSIFFELGLLDIHFDNVYNKPMYDMSYLMNNDSKQLEDSILKVSAADIFDVYDYLKDYKDTTYNVLKQPLTKGRFTGRSVFDVMRDCNARDVFTYLNYVKTYPSAYSGKNWKISEVFATWVQRGAAFSKTEMKDSVLAYAKSPTTLKAFLKKYQSIFEEEDFINTWLLDADEDDEVEFNKSLYAAKLALSILPSNNDEATYYYTYANYYAQKKEYTKAIIYSDSAITYFIKAKNYNGSLLLKLNKATYLYYIDKYDESLLSLEDAFNDIKNNNLNIREETRKRQTAYYYRFKGLNYYYKDEPKLAAENLAIAADLYQQLGGFDNLNTSIKLQTTLAKIYKKQGELIKSLQIYTNLLASYSKINDKKNVADILTQMADIEFSLANYRKAIDQFSTAKEIFLSFEDYGNAGFSQSNIGQAYWNLGKYDSAIAAHTTAIEYRKIAKNYSGLGNSWKKIGGLFKVTGEKNKSLAAYDSASYYYTLGKDSANLKSLLSDIGDVYNNDKQHQKAFGFYMQWHNLNIASKNKSDIVNSLYQLAEASYYFDNDTSIKYGLACLNLAKEIGDKNNEYYAASILGQNYYKNYAIEQGDVYYKQALNVAIEQKNKKLEANCYRSLGMAYNSKLDFEKAIPLFEKALHIYDSLGEKSALPFMYRLIGSAIESKGDFYDARNKYQKSIEIAYNINSRADVGYGYSTLTFLYIIQGELSKAQSAVDSSYNIFKDLNNSWQMAEAYFKKALVYEAKSDGINAIKFYKMADSIYLKENDFTGRSGCLNNIGAVFFYQADYKNSLKYFMEADQLLSKIKVVTEAKILAIINIGESYFYLKDYPKAEKYLNDGYKLATEKKAGRMLTISSSFLGTLYYEMNQYAKSEKYLLEAFALAEKSNETDLYINTGMYLGKLYAAQNNFKQGEFYYNKTTQFTKRIDNSKYTWMALYEYGLYFYNQNKFDSACKYFKEAIVIVENSAQNLFGGEEAKKIYNADYRKVDLYNKVVVSLAKLGNKEDALYYADKSNNQALKEQAERAGLVTNDKEKAEAIKKGGELLQKKNAVDQAIAKEKAKPEKEQNKQLIASLESVKSVTETDYTNYIENLQRKYPDLQSYFANTNPKDFRNYIDYIPDSTIVVLYIINDNQLLIFTVTNKETGLKTIELKQDINKQASRFLSVLRNPNNATGTGAVTLRSTLKPVDDVRGDFKQEANALYNLLITPIAEQLKDKKNICFIPNGKLSNIPFQSLGHVDENKQFHFLMEDYAIFYTSKIDIFKNMFKKRKMESSLAIFGNPDKTLPGATIEAKEISKMINGSVVYIEEQATEDKAKESLAKYNYIHFATHGVLDYDKIEDSYLLFAAGPGENNQGKLTIAEINGLSKQTSSLVVLSACETAVSKEEVKGFYISPTNAFLTNRVDAVIGSLWKVPDETTNLLLQEFYTNIEKKGMSNVQALRNAQATVSANPKFNHPFYWSAFVLYGEWR